MPTKTRFWNAVLVFASAANLLAVWFAARPGEAWHATTHAALAVGFGLWAQRRIRKEDARVHAAALEDANEVEIAELEDEVVAVQRELVEMQERLDFAERLIGQSRETDRLPEHRET